MPRLRARTVATTLAGAADSPPGREGLRGIAESLDVSLQFRDDLPFHGRTDWSGARAVISVAHDIGHARANFVIAHELAHVALRDSFRDSSSHLRHRKLERFCDDVAAELLLPRPWVEARFAEPLDMSSLRQISDESEASWSCVVVRAVRLGKQAVLASWVPGAEGRWHLHQQLGGRRFDLSPTRQSQKWVATIPLGTVYRLTAPPGLFEFVRHRDRCMLLTDYQAAAWANRLRNLNSGEGEATG